MDNKIEINIEELSDNQHGSTTSKVVTLLDGVKKEEALSQLIYDSQDSSNMITLSTKRLISYPYGMEVDSHYNLERFLMLKRDNNICKHRYSIDLSGMLPLLILQGITEDISSSSTNLGISQEDMESMVELSKTLYRYGNDNDVRLNSIIGKTQLIDHYISSIISECSRGGTLDEVLEGIIEYLIDKFNLMKKKLLVKFRSIEGVKAISIGYDNILIDSNVDNLMLFVRFRDLEFSLPVTELTAVV